MDIGETAARYLANRSRTCDEVRRYLRNKGFSEPEIAQQIKEFLELNYLDDLEYCRQYFDYSFRKGKGLKRVRMELEEKGVEAETITLAIESYEGEETEEARAKRQAEKVVAGKEINERLLAKVGRRLTVLGYDSEVIYGIIGSYMRGEDGESI